MSHRVVSVTAPKTRVPVIRARCVLSCLPLCFAVSLWLVAAPAAAVDAPTVTISAPPDNQTFNLNQVVTTSFSCSEATDGPGIESCTDSNGATGGTGTLDTSTAGVPTYAVTAVSQDGLIGIASITYTVLPGSQSITFTSTPPPNSVYGGTYLLTATGGSSGNPIAFSIDPAGSLQACTLAGAVVSFTGTGKCTIDANQSGNADYSAAAQVQQSFSIGKAPLFVTANAATVVFGHTPTLSYTLTGFVNGDTATSATVTGKAACSIAAGTPSDAGTYPGVITCTPRTLAAPNYTFAAGSSATLTINPAPQTIKFASSVSSPTVGGTYVPTATGGASGQPVIFSIDPSSVGCSISGGTVTFTTTGVCVIDANQAGSTDYYAAKTAQQRLVVSTPPNCANTSIGATPLTDLGQGTYHGYVGGLYPGGSNTPPSAYLSDGLAASAQIQPLGSDGTPSSSGRIVLLSVGMSNAHQYFLKFMDDEASNYMKYGIENVGGTLNSNPQVELVNGATQGWDAKKIVRNQSAYIGVLDSDLAIAGVTPDQVQAVWVFDAIGQETNSFPTDSLHLESDFDTIIAMLGANFPNLRIVYLSSREYAGYSLTPSEPYSYEGGFAVQWTVANKIASDPTSLPYVAWGPYFWADGTMPRNDGLVWLCSDFQSDGDHPSATGQKKGASLMESFFTTDPTADTWFDAPVGASGSTSEPAR